MPVKIDVEQGICFLDINEFASLVSNMIVDLGVLLSYYNKVLNGAFSFKNKAVLYLYCKKTHYNKD